MATYTFETITTAQALAITAADNVIVQNGNAATASVIYNAATPTASDTITLTIGAKSVTFGPGARRFALNTHSGVTSPPFHWPMLSLGLFVFESM